VAAWCGSAATGSHLILLSGVHAGSAPAGVSK
jgi:hypothetical protein